MHRSSCVLAPSPVQAGRENTAAPAQAVLGRVTSTSVMGVLWRGLRQVPVEPATGSYGGASTVSICCVWQGNRLGGSLSGSASFCCALAGWATADRRGPACQCRGVCSLPAQPTIASGSDVTGCGLGVAVSGRMAAHYYRVVVVVGRILLLGLPGVLVIRHPGPGVQSV